MLVTPGSERDNNRNDYHQFLYMYVLSTGKLVFKD